MKGDLEADERVVRTAGAWPRVERLVRHTSLPHSLAPSPPTPFTPRDSRTLSPSQPEPQGDREQAVLQLRWPRPPGR